MFTNNILKYNASKDKRVFFEYHVDSYSYIALLHTFIIIFLPSFIHLFMKIYTSLLVGLFVRQYNFYYLNVQKYCKIIDCVLINNI